MDDNGRYREISQIQSRVLSSDATRVLLSAGGNDANFSGVVEACAMSADCTGSEGSYQGNVDYAQRPVAGLIEDLHLRAPTARVVLVGCPHLFTDTNGPAAFHDDEGGPADSQACPLYWAVLVDDTCLSRSSFHPNSAGAANCTATVTSGLPAVGYL